MFRPDFLLGRYGRAHLGALVAAMASFSPASVNAQNYVPPKDAAALLKTINFKEAVPVSEDYRSQFVKCDGEPPHEADKDTFRGFQLSGVYRCSTDRSRVRALLKLPDGAIYWHSKMALDVDGSWAAWSKIAWRGSDGNLRRSTDQCGTWKKWRAVPGNEDDCDHPDAQVNPDVFPYVVIPIAGKKDITGDQHETIGREFRDLTGLGRGDMGVVIYGKKWTPVFIADGGPFMRLGEASTRVFEALDIKRCLKWNADGTRCIGPGEPTYPYINKGLPRDVIFVLYPSSNSASLKPENALATICGFAKTKLGLTGAAVCN